MMQGKEIERLNGVYVNLLKNSGVEYIGMCVVVHMYLIFFILAVHLMKSVGSISDAVVFDACRGKGFDSG